MSIPLVARSVYVSAAVLPSFRWVSAVNVTAAVVDSGFPDASLTTVTAPDPTTVPAASSTSTSVDGVAPVERMRSMSETWTVTSEPATAASVGRPVTSTWRTE